MDTVKLRKVNDLLGEADSVVEVMIAETSDPVFRRLLVTLRHHQRLAGKALTRIVLRLGASSRNR